MPKQYLLEFKRQVVELCRGGMPLPDVGEKFNVTISTLYRWLKEYDPSAEGHTAAEYSTLQRQNTRLNHLLEIIALSQIIDGTPLRRRPGEQNRQPGGDGQRAVRHCGKDRDGQGDAGGERGQSGAGRCGGRGPPAGAVR